MIASTLTFYLHLASGLISTTYGWGEQMCGDVGYPRACDNTATTASGMPLIPEMPSVAVSAPAWVRIPAEGVWIYARIYPAACKWIRVTDKMSPRFLGIRGFDLTPAAVHAMTGEWPTARWSGVLQLCKVDAYPRPRGRNTMYTLGIPKWNATLPTGRIL